MEYINMEELEQKRKSTLSSFRIWYLPLLMALVIGILMKHPIPFFLMGIGGTVVVLVNANKRLKEYKKLYKNTFVRAAIGKAFPGATYDPDSGFTRQMIAATGLMYMGNRYHSEDYIRGVCNDVAFERADILIEDESTDSDGNTTTTTYLKGRWMVFESNKTFNADLQIIQKGFGYANRKKGFFTRKADRRHEFQTEDEVFNKQFSCLCQDESEAFYLLTPGMMQSLINLAQVMDGKIMVGFVDNKIHVAVHSKKDSLEPSVRRPVSEADFAEVQNEISAITSFIGGLKLDRKIFQ